LETDISPRNVDFRLYFIILLLFFVMSIAEFVNILEFWWTTH